MRIMFLIITTACGLMGCVHSRVLTESTPPDTLAQINRDFENRSGQIKLNSGRYVHGRSFSFGTDSLMYATHGEAMQAFPNSEVERVAFRDRKRGLIEGLEYGAGIGAFVGAGVGFMFGSMSSECADCPGQDKMTPAEGLFYGAFAGAIPGAGLGMFFGGTGGSILEVRYRFPANKMQHE